MESSNNKRDAFFFLRSKNKKQIKKEHASQAN
jgi:hypothetical protein